MAEHYDTIVLGGSYAGLTSALTLGRANRRVLVIDAGNPRNRASKGINNLPGNDGISAAAWKDNVLKELAAKYRTVRVVEGTATAATRVSESPTRFEVVYTAKHSDEAIKVVSKTVILAMGASHAMPAVLDRLPVDQSTWWGSRVFHCPYCSAFENSGQPLAILALPHTSAADAVGMAGQLSVWAPGKVTILTNGRDWESEGFNAAQKGSIAANNVSVVSDPVKEITQDAATRDLTVSFTTDRTPLVFHSLHLRPTASLNSLDLIKSLGPTLRGPLIQTDPMGKTDVKGLYAAGDCMEPKAQVLLALQTGTCAAFSAQGDLGLQEWNEGKLGGRL